MMKEQHIYATLRMPGLQRPYLNSGSLPPSLGSKPGYGEQSI
jgi:hypothetical protein